MNEKESSRLVTELAKILIELVSGIAPQWEKAFFRFESDGSYVSANGSYVKNGDAKIFDVLAHRQAFSDLKVLGEQLRNSLEKDGKKFLVCLLTVDSSFNFDVTYDFKSSDRWKISKFGGGTGFPQQ